jgi:hypothetical protein
MPGVGPWTRLNLSERQKGLKESFSSDSPEIFLGVIKERADENK